MQIYAWLACLVLALFARLLWLAFLLAGCGRLLVCLPLFLACFVGCACLLAVAARLLARFVCLLRCLLAFSALLACWLWPLARLPGLLACWFARILAGCWLQLTEATAAATATEAATEKQRQ